MYVPREEQRAYTLTCTYRIFAFKNSITVTQRGKRKNQEGDQSQDKVRRFNVRASYIAFTLILNCFAFYYF